MECGGWGRGGENCGVSQRRWWGFKRGMSPDLNFPVWKSAYFSGFFRYIQIYANLSGKPLQIGRLCAKIIYHSATMEMLHAMNKSLT